MTAGLTGGELQPLGRQSTKGRVPTERARARRYSNGMNTRPIRSGWYWVRRNAPNSVPQDCFWTGGHFLTINPSEPTLAPVDITWFSDGPLEVPHEFFDVTDFPASDLPPVL
jgi:hypothetical protein